MRFGYAVVVGGAALPALLTGVASAEAGASVASGDSVYIADVVAATVTRYEAATASATWVAEVGMSRAIDLALDASGNVVAAGSDTIGFPVGQWDVEFNVLSAADGEAADAEPPFLDQGNSGPLANDLAGFKIVDGDVAGFFLVPPFRETNFVSIPIKETKSFRTRNVAAVGYLGKGYNFVAEIDGDARPGRRLHAINTEVGLEADLVVEQYEPSNELYNSLCRMSLNADGEELVLAAVSSLSRSTPSNGLSTTSCKWSSGDMDTLIVQVINRETLLPKWTATIEGSFRIDDTAVTSANGKVFAVAALASGGVQLTELDAGTGSVLASKQTSAMQDAKADKVKDVYALSSGSVAITGLFEGEKPIVFYTDGKFTPGNDDCI